MPAFVSLARTAVEAVGQRTGQIINALRGLDDRALMAPSTLPGWSRLTIACHLRFGAEALLRMTQAGVSGECAAYYPGGRSAQRPSTLVPATGERPEAVIASLGDMSVTLDRLWRSLDRTSWGLDVLEPPEQPDLGTMPLSQLPLVRLTEVEVHGSDLDLELEDWSQLFVQTVLPMRLRQLGIRRTNHRAFDHGLEGSWLLRADDGPTYTIAVSGDRVETHPADDSASATAVIEASSRDLLALVLGRSFTRPPRLSGDVAFGRAFGAAFPGP